MPFITTLSQGRACMGVCNITNIVLIFYSLVRFTHNIVKINFKSDVVLHLRHINSHVGEASYR